MAKSGQIFKIPDFHEGADENVVHDLKLFSRHYKVYVAVI